MLPLLGRLTNDATVSTLENGKSVVNFSVALNDNYKNKEGKVVELATFINCAYWNRPNIAPYLTKGKLVKMEARLTPDAYINKQGEPVGVIRATVRDIQLLSSSQEKAKGTQKSSKGTKSKNKAEAATPAGSNDDLPF